MKYLTFVPFFFMGVVLCSAQTVISASTIKQELLGSWMLEEDNDSKFVFNNDNQVMLDYNGEIMWTQYYRIEMNGNSCGGEPDIVIIMSETSDFSEKSCYIIMGLNEDNSGFLSLISENGKFLFFEKVP